MQGRLTDFFLFSRAFCGSPLTGYKPTNEWEKKDRRLDLGTAMAISGAAAAPQMGLGTRRRLTFWLALLNVRLGYWVRNPAKHTGLYGSAPGLSFLLKEMLGSMEVAEINPALITRDKAGKPETVRYDAVNAMLLNEFLKEHRRGEEQDCKIQEQETTIAELRSEMKALAARITEQASQLQKVSAWIETSEAKPQFAQNQ